MFEAFKGIADHCRGKCGRDFKKLSDEFKKLIAENETLLPFKEIAQSRINAAREAQWKIEKCEQTIERTQRYADEVGVVNDELRELLVVKDALVVDLHKQMAHERDESNKHDASYVEQINAQEKLITKQRDLIFEYEREKEYYEEEFNKKKKERETFSC